MGIGEWALAISTIAAAVAAIAAAWQLSVLRRQEDQLRSLERRGVAVTWHALTPPNDDKDDIWIYTIEASNPGRFPISDVNVILTFPVDVERVRHSGQLDPPSTTIQVGTPVLLGAGQRWWKRTLQIRPNPEDLLRQVRAEINYLTSEGERVRNYWPFEMRNMEVAAPRARFRLPGRRT